MDRTRRTPSRLSGVLATVLVAAGTLAGEIGAQQASDDRAWLPSGSYFAIPSAAPREAQFHGSLIRTDLLASRLGVPPGGDGLPDVDDHERQIRAALGGTLRLWRPVSGPSGGVMAGVQAGVFGRFRLEGSANELLAADWLVALPVEGRWNDVSGRLRLLHWSAHLGDELIEASGAERVDFTFEALDLLTGYDVGPLRVYGGGAVVLRSQLEDAPGVEPDFSDDGMLQLGLDGGWHPWARGRLGVTGAIDLQWADRADWRRQLSTLVALEARERARAVRVGVRFFDGPSPLGQFFLMEESYWGLEIRIDL